MRDTAVRKKIGWIAAATIPFLLILMFMLGAGFNRTTGPEADDISEAAFDLHLESGADFRSVRGPFPITYRTDFRNDAIVRGKLSLRAQKRDLKDIRLSFSGPQGNARSVGCLPEHSHACYFNADLGRGSLLDGISVTVYDTRTREVLAPPSKVVFRVATRYSLARWDALMGI